MIELSPEQIKQVFGEEVKQGDVRERLRQQSMQFLLANQECYVAQWIIQNPFANISDYRLKFEYNDQTQTGYSASMEKINNV